MFLLLYTWNVSSLSIWFDMSIFTHVLKSKVSGNATAACTPLTGSTVESPPCCCQKARSYVPLPILHLHIYRYMMVHVHVCWHMHRSWHMRMTCTYDIYIALNVSYGTYMDYTCIIQSSSCIYTNPKIMLWASLDCQTCSLCLWCCENISAGTVCLEIGLCRMLWSIMGANKRALRYQSW